MSPPPLQGVILCVLCLLLGGGNFLGYSNTNPLSLSSLFSGVLSMGFGGIFLLLLCQKTPRYSFFIRLFIGGMAGISFLLFPLWKDTKNLNDIFFSKNLEMPPLIWGCWLMISGCVLVFLTNHSKKMFLICELFLFFVLLIAFVGISNSPSSPYLIHSWLNPLSMPFLVACSLICVTICALYTMNHTLIFQKRFCGREEVKIIFLGSTLLILVSLNAVISFFSLFFQQNEELLEVTLNQNLETGKKYISKVLSNEIQEIRALSHFDSLIHLLKGQDVHENTIDIQQALHFQRFHSYQIESAMGQILLKKNPFTPKKMGYFDIKASLPTTLFWDDQWYIHFDVPIYSGNQFLGKLTLEHGIEAIQASLSPSQPLFQSEERLLCHLKEGQVKKCFSSLNHQKMSALLGKDPDVFQEMVSRTSPDHPYIGMTQDPNHTPIVLGIAKLSEFDLVYIIKVNRDDLYQSLYHHFSHSFPLLILFILIGVFLLMWQISPLVRQMIASKKEAEQTASLLLESQTRLKTIVDHMGEAILVTNDQAMIEDFNQAAEDMFGYKKHDIYGHSLSTLLNLPLSPKNPLEKRNGWIETKAFRKNKDSFFVRYLVSEMFFKEKKNFIILAEDITEFQKNAEKIKESHSLFKSSFDYASIGMVLISPQLTFLKINQAFCTMLGVREQDLLNKRMTQMISKESWKKIIHHINQLKRGDIIRVELTIPLIHHNKSLVYTRINVSYISDEKGKISYSIAQVQDISSRKMIEEKLTSTNVELERRIKDLNTHTIESNILTRMSGLLQSCFTFKEAVTLINTYGEKLFPKTSGTLYLSRENSYFEQVLQWGNQPFPPLLHSSDCWGLRRGQAYSLIPHESGVCCHHVQACFKKTHSYICIPLSAQGEIFGLIHLQRETCPSFHSPDFHRSAIAFSDHITLALSNIKLRETLHHQSTHDPLTGLYNRRYMEEKITIEFARSLRKSTSLSFIILDIDHFKKFNDTYGHDVGDLVLIEVSRTLKSHIRDYDILCRMGGEEFMVILPETNLPLAQERAEHIRLAVSQISLTHQGNLLPSITISAGISLFPDHGISKDEVINAADKALYLSKKGGRNQVSIFSLEKKE